MTLLFLMLSTDGDKAVERRALFGSVFFKVADTGAGDGTLGVTMGVANPTALIILFVLHVGFLAVARAMYRGLRQRREQLIKERSNA
ncbi:hypothetical protein AB0A71_20155 [Kitasatospora aureofaciens]|uniref:hypothetical protein n=1 Tax=Kitasatospora aureofaciens TaxID=1894 RepID=UPI0033CD304D